MGISIIKQEIIKSLLCYVILFYHVTIVSSQTCTCDLTANKCDINCCCDPQCTLLDKSTFSFCIPINKNRLDKVCVSDSILFSSYGQYHAEGTGGGMFCIYKDNYQERSLFSNIPVTNTIEQFQSLKSKYKSFSYQMNPFVQNALQDSYKNNDPIYILFDDNRHGYLSQPSSLFTTACQNENPARFLNASQSECIHKVTNLQTQCLSEKSWNATSYFDGFKISPFPSFIVGTTTTPSVANSTEPKNNFSPVNVVVRQPLQCRLSNGSVTDCLFNDIPSPSYDAVNGCKNVVSKVSYNIGYETNGSTVITSVEVSFVFISVQLNTQSFSQFVSTSFFANVSNNSSSGNVTVYQRSGNPGYLTGLPIRSGNLKVDPATKKSTIVASVITLIKSTVTGTCDASATRSALEFGMDYQSGCFMSIKPVMTLPECEQIQKDIYAQLLQQLPTHVASFGNTETVTSVGWVKIINNAPVTKPGLSNGHCMNMVTDVTFQVLYTKTGYIANPQNQIVGFNVKYNAARDLVYRCFGMFCKANTPQKFQVNQLVSHTDVSLAPQVEVRSVPKFKSKAPNDFFYPFF